MITTKEVKYGYFQVIALDEFDDEGDRLYWSNTDGWTAKFEADIFFYTEVGNITLPQGGAWVPDE
jgi:hypothetical protein